MGGGPSGRAQQESTPTATACLGQQRNFRVLAFLQLGCSEALGAPYLHDQDAHSHRAQHMLVVIKPQLHLFIAALGMEGDRGLGAGLMLRPFCSLRALCAWPSLGLGTESRPCPARGSTHKAPLCSLRPHPTSQAPPLPVPPALGSSSVRPAPPRSHASPRAAPCCWDPGEAASGLTVLQSGVVPLRPQPCEFSMQQRSGTVFSPSTGNQSV